MLKNLSILILFLISIKAFADIDNNVLKDELFKITEYDLKNNIYTLHLAANDFEEMNEDELNLNKLNIDKLVFSKILSNNTTEEEREKIRVDLNNIIEKMYYEKDARLNQAAVYNIPVGNIFISLILIPNRYYVEYKDCAGPFILFDSYTCFKLPPETRGFLTKYIKKYYVPELSSDFITYYTITHEYSHTLPQQLRRKPEETYALVKNMSVKKDEHLITHFNEVYSDLYAAIRMLKMGYNKSDLNQVIFMRDLSLYIYDDVIHYSSPYIKKLQSIPSERYLKLDTFEEIDSFIVKIFSDVINEKNTMDYKNFYDEELEMKPKVSDIARFVNNINSNTFSTEDNKIFVIDLFNQFVSRIYFSNKKFELRFLRKDNR